MQTDTLATDESAATAKSPDSTLPQQPSAAQPDSVTNSNSALPDTNSTLQPDTPSPEAAPAISSAQPVVDEELAEMIDDLIKDLRQSAAYALGWRIKMAIHLDQFRDNLGEKDWLSLLRCGRLPFSSRTAQTLARIGGHAILADLRNAQKLPQSMTVLNEVAALPPCLVEQALANGTIHPGTTLAEAKKIAAEHRAKKQQKLPQLSRIKPI